MSAVSATIPALIDVVTGLGFVGVLALVMAAALPLLLLWAAAYAAIPVGLQTTVFRAAPDAREAATTLYATTFNSSIAIGALFGAFAIDRGGVVGPDGATHAGNYDLAYLRCIPNME